MAMTKVKELVKQVRGVSYKPGDLHNELNENSVILLRANNIDDGQINFDDVVYVDKSKVSFEQYLKIGDVLICASSGSKNLVGKAASVRMDKECTFGAFCKVVRPKEGFEDYLGVYFQSPIYRRKISDMALGANINNIRNEHIDSLDIPVYSEMEQEDIVKKIHLLQEIISNRRAELAKLDDLIKARFIELFNGKKYNYVKVSDVCDFITKGTTPKSDEIFEEYEAGRIPYLKVYNLSLTGDLFFDDAPQYINASTHEEKLARSKVYPNDVLMNIVGPPLGKFAFVTNEFNEWNINQAIAIFRAREKVIPRFLMAALMQPDVLQPFLQQAVGIRQLNLSLEQCRNLEIPLPPLELQQQFSVFVAEVDKSKVGKQRDSCVS